MPRTYKPTANLVSLQYNPTNNPLVEAKAIRTKEKTVRATRGQELLNPTTGEIDAFSAILQKKEVDDIEFVKIFADGITAAYELTKTAQRVFQIIIDQYQRTPMTGGYTDAIDLYWFGNGIEGRDANMSQYTFNRGLRELLDKQFIAPKTPHSYWINPALFFKGNRVVFIKEYIRKNGKQTNDTQITKT